LRFWLVLRTRDGLEDDWFRYRKRAPGADRPDAGAGARHRAGGGHAGHQRL